MAKTSSPTRLVVVESPAKARTISKYLGAGYRVKASVGHIRDLPERELGVDIENGFEPRFVTIRGKGKVILDLRRDAEASDEIVLATDPDREGEAIAYHVAEQLGYVPGKDEGRFRRVLFHEVTRDAIHRALDTPGRLDMRKVEAQQARRILDRLVGYQVSPLLWKPIRPGLSAGRVQTVALRLIAEREVEIRAFEPQEYWSITAHLERTGQKFDARLHQIDGKAFRLENEASAQQVLDDVDGVPFVVTELKRRERLKNPPAPFTTSTLQQEAAKRLGFTAQRTMRVAQQLYEGMDVGPEGTTGLITYMRTDSTRVAVSAVEAARTLVAGSFGDRYLADKPRLWGGTKTKGAQEAHEAIRPTEAARRPDQLRSFLDKDQLRLYELIWLRFVAGQMAPAVYDTTTVDFNLRGNGRQYLFRATGSIITFDGFTRLYQEAREEGDHRTLDDLDPLPKIAQGDTAELTGLEPAQHFTQPPPRFTEASLVKELERLGIGRPSTYAAIISTLTDREYAQLEQKRFHPTPLGETVSTVLTRVFPDLFDVDFTSGMEAQLDRIEEGEIDWRRLLADFYGPFQAQLVDGAERSQRIVRETVSVDTGPCPECGRELQVRWNRFGRFLGCTGYPECRHTQSIDEREKAEPVLTRVFPDLFDVDFTSGMEAQLDRIEEGEIDWRRLLADFYGPFQAQLVDGAERSQRIVRETVSVDTGPCPECGRELQVRWNRFGRFLGCTGYPECRHTQSIDEREKAEPVLTGEMCPNCGSPMVEREGRFGPFVACSNYPTCKHTQPKTVPGMTCPQCEQGAVGEKRTRKGKPFWGCVRYPDCDWSSWDPPVPQPCESCGAPYLVRKNTKAKGDFLKCLTCKAEYTQDGQGAAEPASGPARTPAQRRAATAEQGNGRTGERFGGGRSGGGGKRGGASGAASPGRKAAKKAGAKKSGAKAKRPVRSGSRPKE